MGQTATRLHLPQHQPASGLWVRSALAPPLWSRWLAVGLGAIVAIAIAEIALGAHAAIGSAFAVVALVVGLVGGRGDAIAVAAACVAAAAISGVLGSWDAPWTITLLVVAASSIAAVLVALLRAAAVTTSRQLELLRRLAGLANNSGSVESLANALLDLLVPGYADVAMLDLAIQDHDRRVGVRVAGPHGREAEEWLRARRPVDVSQPGAERAIVTGQPWLVADVDDELLRAIATDDADLAQLRGLEARSALTLPLATRGAPFGALSLLIGVSGRRYTRADL
ncbi:MAG: hypothetical protein QOG77_3483, partial [Solirubrobacteraceae bacterium]|nr:hypothetical protein [Solirubrobacteraceae bacterium]